VAVKKVAKKVAAKKAVVEKAAAKVAPVKKAAAKKAVVKKAAAKKVAATNIAPTPTLIQSGVAKKVVAKKAVAKKIVAKRTPIKKTVVKKAAKKMAAPLVIPALLPTPAVFISSETPLASVDYFAKPAPAVVTSVTPKAPMPAQKSSSRVVLWVIIGVVAIAALVVARDHKAGKTTPDSTPTSTAAASPSATAGATSSPTAMAPTPSSAPTGASTTPTTSDPAPVGIVAHYNSTGATIFWSPGAGAIGLTTYNVDAAANGGAFKLIATIPATQLSLDVTEKDTVGWTSFKISAVYSDGRTVAGKIFGLPGQYS